MLEGEVKCVLSKNNGTYITFLFVKRQILGAISFSAGDILFTLRRPARKFLFPLTQGLGITHITASGLSVLIGDTEAVQERINSTISCHDVLLTNHNLRGET